jgi:hypothetical protein
MTTDDQLDNKNHYNNKTNGSLYFVFQELLYKS